MEDTKGAEVRINSHEDAELQGENVVVSEKKGTPDDQKDMHRMGKMQEMRASSSGFSCILT